MNRSGVLKKSGSGSEVWVAEKMMAIMLVPSALYIFFYFLLSYKLTGLQFYLNLFFVNLLNICVAFIFMLSGGVLSYLRFGAILNDYIKSSHAKLIAKVIFLFFNIFFFTFVVFTFMYFNYVISITTL